jgi:hypothetical protein
MIPPEQFKPNWTAIGVVGGLVVNVSGWFVVHFLTKRREAQRDQRAKQEAASADRKRQDAAASEWRSGFREIVVHLRTEMDRGESPSDWFPTFDRTIPILNRVAANMPAGMDSPKRSEITSIVGELTRMSGGQGEQAVYGAQKVVHMLLRLEELTNDTQPGAAPNGGPAKPPGDANATGGRHR